jgi:hypothetical protein
LLEYRLHVTVRAHIPDVVGRKQMPQAQIALRKLKFNNFLFFDQEK